MNVHTFSVNHLLPSRFDLPFVNFRFAECRILPQIIQRRRKEKITHLRNAHLPLERAHPCPAPRLADPARLTALFTPALATRFTARAARQQVTRLLRIDLVFHDKFLQHRLE